MCYEGKLVETVVEQPDIRSMYNELLNEGDFVNYNGMVELFDVWVQGCWDAKAKVKTHSTGFAICQSSGTGKTKLIQYMGKRRDRPYWVFHLVCREAQLNQPNPVVQFMHDRLSHYLGMEKRNQAALMAALRSNEFTPNERQSLTNIIDKLSVDMLRYFIGFLRFLKEKLEKPKTKFDQRSLIELFRFPQSDDDVDKCQAVWEDILSKAEPVMQKLPAKDPRAKMTPVKYFQSLAADLLAALPAATRKMIVCFDEARGLFGLLGQEQIVNEANSLVFRAIRRCSNLIYHAMQERKMEGLVVFVYMDTNSGIENFLLPFGSDPSADRAAPRDLVLADPLYPSFSFLLTVDRLSPADVQRSRNILSGRTEESIDDRALELLASIGRPLWKKRFEIEGFDGLVDQTVTDISTYFKKKDVSPLAILAMRLPFRISEIGGIASRMVSRAFGVLIFFDPEEGIASVRYVAEPALTAAVAEVMRSNPDLVLGDLLQQLSYLGFNAGLGGEVLSMMMALAATDSLTTYRPYLSVNLGLWIQTWLGLSDESMAQVYENFPTCRDSLIACGQFVSAPVANLQLDVLRRGIIQSVGLLPCESNQKAVDIIIPFETASGKPSLIAAQFKNRKNFDYDAPATLVAYCGEASKKGKKGEELPVIPVIIQFAHGRGILEEAKTFPSASSRAKAYFYPDLGDSSQSFNVPIHLTNDNSWDRPEVLASVLASSEDDILMEERYWLNTVYKFKIPVHLQIPEKTRLLTGIRSDTVSTLANLIEEKSGKRKNPSPPQTITKKRPSK